MEFNLDAIKEYLGSDQGNTLLKGAAGFLSGLNEDRKNNAYAQAEIAKTQYGHLLGQGIGNPYQYNTDETFGRTAQGLMAGEIEARDKANRQAQIDAINALGEKRVSNPYQSIPKINTEAPAPVMEERIPDTLRAPLAQAENPYVLQETQNNSSQDIVNSLTNSMLGVTGNQPTQNYYAWRSQDMINNNPYSKPGSLLFAGVK